MDPFLKYLASVRDLLVHNVCATKAVLHIVIGNESCDLDSTVSSLAYAYFLSETKYKGDDSTVVVPILNVEQRNFALRTENVYLLKKLDVNLTNLAYSDAFDFSYVAKLRKMKVTLVDHHVNVEKDSFLNPLVVQIFDHRPEDVNANWDGSKVDVHIVQVGSCATLIANEFLNNAPNLLCNSLATFLYETIIFDTIGFKPSAGKAKELDFQVAQNLEKILNIQRDRLDIFSELWKAHNDVSKLTPVQLLSKDLKIVNDVCIPGLPMMAEKYLNLPGVETALMKFLKRKKCTCMIIMGLEAEDDVKRDLAFYPVTNDNHLMMMLIKAFKGDDSLQLEEGECNIPNVKFYFQKNAVPSRKQVLPVVKDIVNQYAASQEAEEATP